jgi:hypothetical protein
MTLAIVFFLLMVNPSLCDVVNLTGATSWKLINKHTIMVFSGNRPIALIEFWPYEIIFASSQIEYIDPIIMRFSKMRIDGRVCEIYKLKSLK